MGRVEEGIEKWRNKGRVQAMFHPFIIINYIVCDSLLILNQLTRTISRISVGIAVCRFGSMKV